MIASGLISVQIDPVHRGDAIADVLDLMCRFKVAQWPVLKELDYVGLVSESDLTKADVADFTLEAAGVELSYVFVYEDQHLLEIIDILSRLKVSLIPVLTRDKTYKGSIRITDLLPGMALLSGSGRPGAVLVLSMAVRDYTLAGISRIIEENNAKIMGLFTAPETESGDLLVTLKLNTDEIAAILRSFERFGITVRSHFQGDEEVDDMYRSRFEELMRYINT